MAKSFARRYFPRGNRNGAMIQIYWPATSGEWLAFAAAAVAALEGLAILLFPRPALALLALRDLTGRGEAVALARGPVAGFPLALGLLCILFAQPFLYMALGASFAAAAAGRMIAMVFDGANLPRNGILLLAELALAGGPLAYALGYLP
jgi:hypothetical protein